MLTASIYVDLTTEPGLFDSSERRALTALENVPDGARVVVDVGSRRCPTQDAANYLHRHVNRLQIELQGTPTADMRAWLDAVRLGRPWLEVVA